MSPDVRAVMASVQGSTAAVDHPWLVPFVELALEARAGRVESAAALNERRAEGADLVRGRIRAVVGTLPLNRPLRELVPVVRQRLNAKGWTAGDWQIKDELRVLRAESRAALATEPCLTRSGVSVPATASTEGGAP